MLQHQTKLAMVSLRSVCQRKSYPFYFCIANSARTARTYTPLEFPDSDREDEDDSPPGLEEVEEDSDDDDDEDDGTNSNDDDGPITAGSKCSRSPNEYPPGQPLQKTIKLFESQGKPKASDYDPSVHALLKLAIFLFRGKLSTENPFPDAMLAMTWAKSVWLDACKMCDTWIQFNSEIIKLV